MTHDKNRLQAVAYFRDLQDRICAGLEAIDGKPFREDSWERSGGGGGGSSGGSGGSQSSQEQSSGLTLDDLAALLGFADAASFAGWLGQIPFEEMEFWLSLLAD